ncbi:MAG: two component transcriptional regulator, LuxR family [Edaphobacter sp.]|nr:two component transcriptional regulator, LuxR family [Edaphobacter sp.]
MKTRVLLVDDHPPLVEAALTILKPRYDIVGIATDGAMLILEALRLSPDLIVSDITLPILNGIEAIHRLRLSNSQVKVVFLTVHAEEGFLKACMAEGALGYVLKSRMKTQLIPAIEAALEGRSYVSPFVAK